MTQLPGVSIKNDDRALKRFVGELVTLWNNGKVTFNLTNTVPADEPADVEMRAYYDGASIFRLYVYIPAVGWKSTTLS